MKTVYKKLALATAISSFTLAGTVDAGQRSVRIIGGDTATPNTYPWMTSLQYSDGQHICGASLISDKWVMTAAHCIEGAAASEMQVVIGDYDLQQADSGEVKRAIKRIIGHAEYSDDHDIAVLELTEAVDNVQPVILMTSAQLQALSVGSSLTVMGWGNRSTDGEDFPNKLHEVNVPLADAATCAESYKNVDIDITDNMICAGLSEGGKDSCQGDSGGPLVVQQDGKWVQLGVVSFGEECAAPNYPGVYTKVANYLDWIETAKNTPFDPNNTDGPDYGSDSPDDADYGEEYGDDEYGDWEEGFEFDEDEFDYAEMFGLPHYLVFETNIEAPEAVFETVTLVNDSEGELSIKGVFIENAESFSIEENHCESRTLALNESCDIKVSFTLPEDYSFDFDDYGEEFAEDDAFDEDDWNDGEEGDYDRSNTHFEENGYADEGAFEGIVEGYLVVELDNEENPEIAVALLGYADYPALPFYLPEYVDFTATGEGSVAEESLWVFNDSDNPLTVQAVTIEDSTHFSVVENGCEGEVLAAEDECEIKLAYTAGTEQEVETELTLTTTDPDNSTVKVTLYGETLQSLEVAEDELLDWYFDGDTPWGISNEEAFELVTDLLAENTDALLMTEVEGPATLEFDFELDGDSTNNLFYFLVDGEVVRTIDGQQVGKVHHQVQLSEGQHKVEWVYRKQETNTEGATARVSNVKVSGTDASNSTENSTSTDSSSNNTEASAEVTAVKENGGGGSTGFSLLGLLLLAAGLRKAKK